MRAGCAHVQLPPPCPALPDAGLYFTVTLAPRGTKVLTRDIAALRFAVRRTRLERPFGIAAWVVLPDHLPCIWQLLEGDAESSTRWRAIKARLSRALPPVARRKSHEARREHGIWQRRFWEHHIRDAHLWETHRQYCWVNPVKHGLVAHPRDWPYSRLHCDAAQDTQIAAGQQ